MPLCCTSPRTVTSVLSTWPDFLNRLMSLEYRISSQTHRRSSWIAKLFFPRRSSIILKSFCWSDKRPTSCLTREKDILCYERSNGDRWFWWLDLCLSCVLLCHSQVETFKRSKNITQSLLSCEWMRKLNWFSFQSAAREFCMHELAWISPCIIKKESGKFDYSVEMLLNWKFARG